MASKFVGGWRDFDNDRQEVAYDVNDAATAADWTGFMSAIQAWTAGASGGGGFYDEQAVDLGEGATSPIAQSRSQAIMELTDNDTGRVYKKRIPFPNMAKAADAGTDPAFIVAGGNTVFNPDHADYATLKTEVETHMISPAGNSVTLTRVYIEE